MKKVFIILIALFVYSIPVLAEDFDLDKFLLDMENSEKTLENVKFDYTQEISFPLTGEKQISNGQVIFAKPSNIYIKQLKPLEQIIVSDGKKVWIYTPDYNQVITDNWKKWTKNSMIPDSLLNMKQNWTELKEKYSFAYADSEPDSRILLLTPKKKDIWKIKFWVNSKTYIVNKLILYAENISVATTSYNYKINTEIDKNIFKFKPPKGAEVLKME
ncbi:MAG: outer membrane lipoprotein carrier protein LolA [Elusimicrobiota bacterium]